MSEEFNKDVMFENIAYLLKKNDKKIGELESEAGVSAGYISRTSKDEKTKPGIEFIMNVADSLGVSVDTLLKVRLSDLTPTEQYIISFVEKLIRDTKNDKLSWNRESADSLNSLACDINGNPQHTLFEYKSVMWPGETEYPEEHEGPIFESRTFGDQTYIHGDCFNLRLKNDTRLYLMNISKPVYRVNDRSALAKEIWMSSPGGVTQFMCSNKGDGTLPRLVDELYDAVMEDSNHPKVNSSLQYAIDAFMKDDLSDDPDSDFPF